MYLYLGSNNDVPVSRDKYRSQCVSCRECADRLPRHSANKVENNYYKLLIDLINFQWWKLCLWSRFSSNFKTSSGQLQRNTIIITIINNYCYYKDATWLSDLYVLNLWISRVQVLVITPDRGVWENNVQDSSNILRCLLELSKSYSSHSNQADNQTVWMLLFLKMNAT